MDPVMRVLQSIADVESETRELGQLEPASACREPIRLTPRVRGLRI